MKEPIDPRIPEELREWYRGAEDAGGERMTGLRSECRAEHRALLRTGAGRFMDCGVILPLRCAHFGFNWIVEEHVRAGGVGEPLKEFNRRSASIEGEWFPLPGDVSWDEAEEKLLSGTLPEVLAEWLRRPVTMVLRDVGYVAPVRAL